MSATLLVKGYPTEARQACDAKGFDVQDVKYNPTYNETTFVCARNSDEGPTSWYLRLGRWLNETPAIVQGKGYPVGTLLHFQLD